MSIKKRALRRSKTIHRDTEGYEPLQPSRCSKVVSAVKAPFRATFWEDLFERTDDETLVDAKLLSYAYLEAGVIEMIGRSVKSCHSRMRRNDLRLA